MQSQCQSYSQGFLQICMTQYIVLIIVSPVTTWTEAEIHYRNFYITKIIYIVGVILYVQSQRKPFLNSIILKQIRNNNEQQYVCNFCKKTNSKKIVHLQSSLSIKRFMSVHLNNDYNFNN